MKATIGRMVTVLGVHSNGATEAPAVITRAWSDRDVAEGGVMVNLTIFPDMAPPLAQGSVTLFETAEEAHAWRGGNPVALAAHWPTRA
jgi:hypothetical protein